MARFRTELFLSPAPFQWGLANPVLALGSCFAEVMGKQLSAHKLPVRINPFGTIFNPLSIGKLLEASLSNQLPEGGWVERDGWWRHYDFHSRFTAPHREEVEAQISQALLNTHQFLHRTDVLLLTFGTAWVYQLKATGAVVANCHKVPAAHFEHHLLSINQIAEAFESAYRALKASRPTAQVILTVSPVRHTRDTLPLNQVSKATLRLACHHLTERWPDVHYFPSYELMIDDLRDYRFYQPDMIHPNEVAETYIWEKLATYLDAPTRAFIAEWADVQKALAHRPFQPDTPAYRQFLEKTLCTLEKLSARADVREEMEEVKKRMNVG